MSRLGIPCPQRRLPLGHPLPVSNRSEHLFAVYNIQHSTQVGIPTGERESGLRTAWKNAAVHAGYAQENVRRLCARPIWRDKYSLVSARPII